MSTARKIRRGWFQFALGAILLAAAMTVTLRWSGWTPDAVSDGLAVLQRLRPSVSERDADPAYADTPTGVAQIAPAPRIGDEVSRPIQPTTPYPIRKQLGIWPPELPTISHPLPPRGATSVSGYIFAENDVDNRAPAEVQVDYLRVYADVKGRAVLVNNDDYGRAAGQQPVAWGNWTPRADMTDPSIEIPGRVADAWAPNYFTTIPSKHPDYATQIWNAKPGRVPAGATKVWVEARLRVKGSGLAHIGFDWYGPKGYVTNGGYSGFQIFAAPDWQVVTFGK